jgi:DNA adenine methylase
VDSPIIYIGGKSRISKQIIEMMPEHKAYCEVFAGAAWVFFRKEPVKYEVLNDLDGDLVAFYRVVQNHLEEFLRQFRWILSSREWFEDYKRQIQASGLTDIQRAARFYYIQRQAFSGVVRNPSFGINPRNRPRINLLRIEEEMSEVHLRLTNATIENLDWRTFIDKYDRNKTILYLDPPYYKAEVSRFS